MIEQEGGGGSCGVSDQGCVQVAVMNTQLGGVVKVVDRLSLQFWGIIVLLVANLAASVF